MTGVPHYITDATITMLVSTFGISIGEVERRFYKGIDTGERFVRLKPRARTQIPDFVTVGGCKILIRVIQPDEVIQPFTLQSIEGLGDGDSVGGGSGSGCLGATSSAALPTAFPPAASSSNNNGNGPKSRSKLGHCNGVMNSTGNGNGHSSLGILSTLSNSSAGGGGGINTFGGTTDLLTSRTTELIPIGTTGLNSTPLCSTTFEARERERERDEASASGSRRRSPSPKIGKSLASRISTGSMIKTSADEVDLGTNTYISGDPLDIPTLSPPPYKAPGSSSAGGSTSGSIANGGGLRHGGRRDHGNENGLDGKSSSQQSGSGVTNGLAGAGSASSMMQKYSKMHSTSANPSSGGGTMPHRSAKTDSSTSLTSSLAGKSTEALKDGSGGGNKRASGGVMFEEDEEDESGADEGGRDKSHRSRSSKSSKGGILNQKTVNGILRKGSGPGDEPVPQESKREKKSRKRDGHHKHKSKSRTRLEAVSESAAGGGGGGGAGSGSGSDKEGGGGNGKEKVPFSKSEAREMAARKAEAAKKANKANKDSKELKHQKDLALTRDLPWCGCWGNGCL